jgi:tRNA G18 (ribose-2'-O)-methylase SpoU
MLRDAGFALLALTPDASAVPIEELAPGTRARNAIVLGAEGPGLQQSTLDEVGTHVRISMSAGVDSLNVGAAAAVAFYALTR